MHTVLLFYSGMDFHAYPLEHKGAWKPKGALNGYSIQVEIKRRFKSGLETVEAILDENGVIHLSEPVKVKAARRVLVSILRQPPIGVQIISYIFLRLMFN